MVSGQFHTDSGRKKYPLDRRLKTAWLLLLSEVFEYFFFNLSACMKVSYVSWSWIRKYVKAPIVRGIINLKNGSSLSQKMTSC